jgi:hypothetical protein
MSHTSGWDPDAPPELLDAEAALAATSLVKRPANVPKGSAPLTELVGTHAETVEAAPNRLDPELTWFVPGLAYCMMGLDRSLFELYAWASSRTVPVKTYRTQTPLCLFTGVDISANPWFHTVQGISSDVARVLIEYIASFEFRRGQVEPKQVWALVPEKLRIRDPFVSARTQGVNVIAWLPHCRTTGRRVVCTEPAGLQLSTPVLGIRRDPVA